jgi:succinate dehydrogenase / fumarate reductase, iron-sulfur subunit
MQISVKIRRQANRTSSPVYQTYTVEADPNTSTVLDILHKIQWEQDGSLVFRRNCRNVICGSCGMRVNGKAGLACQKLVSEVFASAIAYPSATSTPVHLFGGEERNSPESTLLIEPMGNLPVIKDLVVDMTKFWQNLAKVDPYVDTVTKPIPETEFLQTPQQRQKLQAAANCILCGSCYSDCNAAAVSENFVGPHALAKAYRVLADNRDDRTSDRIAKYNGNDFVWGCTRCYNCNEVCPVDVQPMDRISQVKQEILQSTDLPDSTAQRHRHTMVELVKADGWIDESKFGLKVVGKDLKGLISIIPLGLRMILRGKMPFPWNFKRSQGAEEVKSLLEAVQNRAGKELESETNNAEEVTRGG